MSVGFVKFCLGVLKAFRWFPWGFLRFAGFQWVLLDFA